MANKKKFVLILNEIKVQKVRRFFFSISVPSILTYQEIIFYRTLPLTELKYILSIKVLVLSLTIVGKIMSGRK